MLNEARRGEEGGGEVSRYERPDGIGPKGWHTTWRRELEAAAADDGPLISCTLSDAELDELFESGLGGTEGRPFTAWTERYVYFPVDYDGSEWVGRAPRNPCSEATEHQGAGG